MILLILLLAQDPKAAFDRGDYVTAIRLFQAANLKKPECANSLYIGLAQHRLKQENAALLSFRAALQCDPTLVAAHLAFGDASRARGNDNEALSAYLEVLKLEPNHALALRAAADLYLKNDLHLKAKPLLETLLKVAPAADVHADLGAVLATSGDRPAAEASFREALKLQADYFPALTGLGNLLARGGDNAASLPLLRKAATVRPKAWEAHFLLGSALNRMDQFAEAQRELTLASQLGGGSEPQVFYQLGRAWGGLGKAAERKIALAKFSELTKKEKDSADRQREAARLVDEARTLLQSGDLETAAARLELAREARPGDATLLFRLAGLNFDLQRLDVAREYAQAAISISPTTWLYHYLLGLVEKASGHLQDSRSSLETAAQLNATEAPVFNALGEVRMELKDKVGAIQAFEKAVALAPAELTFRQNLETARRP